MARALEITRLPPVSVDPGQWLTYTIHLTNTGILATMTRMTTTFSFGLDTPYQEVDTPLLFPLDGYEVTYARRVVATTSMTITVRVEIETSYGSQNICLYYQTVGSDSIGTDPDGDNKIYLPLVLKRR